LQAVVAGDPALSPALATKILGEFVRLAHEGPRETDDALTAREQEVLQLVAEGSSNPEVATALHLSRHTVNFHMKNILHKLHLKNRAQAVAYAVRTGLANPPEER